MKKIIFNGAICAAATLVFSSPSYSQIMDDEERSAACAATLCLAMSSGRPRECDDAVERYFRIKVKNSLGMLDPRRTMQARQNFLDLCPSGNDGAYQNAKEEEGVTTDDLSTDDAEANIANTDFTEQSLPFSDVGDIAGAAVTNTEEAMALSGDTGLSEEQLSAYGAPNEGQMEYFREQNIEFDSRDIQEYTRAISVTAERVGTADLEEQAALELAARTQYIGNCTANPANTEEQCNEWWVLWSQMNFGL